MIPQVFSRPEDFVLVGGVNFATPFALLDPSSPRPGTSQSFTGPVSALAVARRKTFALATLNPVSGEFYLPGSLVPFDLTNPLGPVVQTPVSAQYDPVDVAIGPNDDFALVVASGPTRILPYGLSSEYGGTNPLAPVLGTPAALPGSSFPLGIAIAPSGEWAYLFFYDNSRDQLLYVAPVNLSNPMAPVVVGSGVEGSSSLIGRSGRIVIAPNGLSLLVAQPLMAYDISSPTSPVLHAVTPTDDDALWIAYSPDGKSGLLTNPGDNTISAMDLTNPLAPVVQTPPVAVGNSPQGVAITPDGAFGVVCNSGDNTLSFLSLTNPLLPVVAATPSIGYSPMAAQMFFR